MYTKLDFRAFALTLFIAGLVSYLLCIAGDLLLNWTMYQAWMRLFYPIGFIVSHVMMGTIFYLILTPIGLAMRLAGHDPLQRRWDANARSYWTRHAPSRDITRYFRQS